jgi:hypothetical protein
VNSLQSAQIYQNRNLLASLFNFQNWGLRIDKMQLNPQQRLEKDFLEPTDNQLKEPWFPLPLKHMIPFHDEC